MDDAGFRALFESQFGDVWRFVRRRCSSGDQADDVAAETFAVAWRRRDGLPPGPQARLWLFGTARLVLANQRRSEQRQARLDDRLASQPAGPPAVDPADQVVDADARGLGTALASLSSDDREVLIMRAWDGLAVTEIAALLGCTPNAASGRLHKARGRLAAALSGADAGDPATCTTGPTTQRTEGDGR